MTKVLGVEKFQKNGGENAGILIPQMGRLILKCENYQRSGGILLKAKTPSQWQHIDGLDSTSCTFALPRIQQHSHLQNWKQTPEK